VQVSVGLGSMTCEMMENSPTEKVVNIHTSRKKKFKHGKQNSQLTRKGTGVKPGKELEKSDPSLYKCARKKKESKGLGARPQT